MTKLSIDVPDDLKDRLQARATEGGFDSVEQYAEAVLRMDAAGAGDVGGPDHLSPTDDRQLEAMLLERLDDPAPAIEVTEEFWTRLRQEAQARRDSRSSR